MKNISLIIPFYNEEKYAQVFMRDLQRALKQNPSIKNVICINDGSSDATGEILESFKTKIIDVIHFKKNKGKGYALRQGFHQAKLGDPDAVIFMDGDRQHDPYYLTDFIKLLKQAPVVFGYRTLDKSSPWIRRYGNKLASFVMSNLFGIKRRDILCGFMAFRKDVFNDLVWHSRDYGVEAEISSIIGKYEIPFEQVHIRTIYLDKHKGVTLLNAFWILTKVPFWYLASDRRRDPRMEFKLFWILTALIALIYLVLAFKKPFVPVSLAGNLEPYPDTLYYAKSH